MKRLILTTTALTLLGCVGFVHGLWTDRWSEQLDLGAAAQTLGQLPREIGQWHGEDVEIEKDPRNALAGMLSRCYTHALTGRQVTLFLACGRPGPVATHTPDVCYVCQGFVEAEGPRRYQLPSATAQAPPEFWTGRYVKQRNDGQVQLRIYWSWFARGNWQAAENPRLSFAGERILHKMYVIREQGSHEPASEREPCVEFIQELLPELQRMLTMEATPTAASHKGGA
jgi:hypothetical protein